MDRGRRLDRAFATRELEPRRRPWVHRVTYGVQRLRGRLDTHLDAVLTRPLASAKPAMRAVLRMGLFELLETDSPAYAVLSQSVDAARLHGGEGGARLTNAVLRKLSKPGVLDTHFGDPERDLAAYLSTWGSHPSWLIERWLSRWSKGEVRALVDANNRIPTVYLRASDGDVDRLKRALEAEGVAYGPEVTGTGCLPLSAPGDLARLLPAVGAFVQDPAGAWVAASVGAAAGDLIVDLCAAPGGKARALAAAGARVVAGDLSPARAALMKAGFADTGIPVFVGDGRHPPLRPGPCILLDAPCTGTGTLGRHPDGRWRLTPEMLQDLAILQADLLDAAARVVTSGGLLVYATCSLEPEENRDQIVQFLARHPDFSLEVPNHVDPALLDREGHLEVLPQKTGFDGAFAARLRRSS